MILEVFLLFLIEVDQKCLIVNFADIEEPPKSLNLSQNRHTAPKFPSSSAVFTRFEGFLVHSLIFMKLYEFIYNNKPFLIKSRYLVFYNKDYLFSS